MSLADLKPLPRPLYWAPPAPADRAALDENIADVVRVTGCFGVAWDDPPDLYERAIESGAMLALWLHHAPTLIDYYRRLITAQDRGVARPHMVLLDEPTGLPASEWPKVVEAIRWAFGDVPISWYGFCVVPAPTFAGWSWLSSRRPFGGLKSLTARIYTPKQPRTEREVMEHNLYLARLFNLKLDLWVSLGVGYDMQTGEDQGEWGNMDYPLARDLMLGGLLHKPGWFQRPQHRERYGSGWDQVRATVAWLPMLDTRTPNYMEHLAAFIRGATD